MRIVSKITDKRINSSNLLIELKIEEYLSFANELIDNNELQRKRVKTSKTVYSLLKNDLIIGCVMPPIVLAIIDEDIESDSINDDNIESILNNKENVLILDGLQRTYTLFDALRDVAIEDKERFLKNMMRIELYAGINKFGILYRMLTLNTGQTPMSTRHQLEMLYNNLLGQDIRGVTLISDSQGKADPDENQFIFKNAIEGFNSYMSRDELPMDRLDILENIKMLDNISEEEVSQDLFREFVELYIKFFNKVREITENHEFTADELANIDIEGTAFGKSASKVFSTSQAMTGFGAAIGKMKDWKILTDFSEVERLIDGLSDKNQGCEWLEKLLKHMDEIKNTSKKIGNAQRMYFMYFYRDLFNSDCDAYLNLAMAVDSGYSKYNSQVN